MKAIIIDDEPKARSLLSVLLDENCPDISQIEVAEDLPSGVELIKKMSPDIVFLDIEMPEYSGIQILDFLNPTDINFEIIFTTAYSEYAINAFELNAISYLLKPLRSGLLKEAVEKAKLNLENNKISNRLTELKIAFDNGSFNKIGLPVSNGIIFIPLEEIYLCKADGMYTKVYTKKDGDLIISKPLKYIIDLLKEKKNFFRTHRSFLINTFYVKQFVKTEGSSILMENGVSAAISMEKRDELLDLLTF